MKKLYLLLLLMLILVLSACSGGDTLTVGTQTYSETKTMGYMYKELIEANTDLSVEVKTDMATDTLVLEAMMSDELEIGTTYTGTALASFFTIENPRDREATMKQTQDDFREEYNIKVYDELGFANTYALAVTEEFAEEHNIEAISDLENIAEDLNFGSDTSWLERRGDDGYTAFTELYGFEFGDSSPMSPNLVYDALNNDDMDVVLAYSTDARIDTYNLKTLEDDMQFFPPYDASTYVKQETLDEYPELDDIFSELVGKIDLDTIRQLNRKVDVDGEDPHDVAIEYLKEQGMLE
ncbi:glycine betaine ABC transporter substrate-binding protein [Ornithinibacillus halophilus]|uniref:Osmoprotectant transport system substrate-binding protein n=1 Tax=Ornithinibacillus halophilus TaxID=930117 RepID=A0A1M5MWP7_9BACI|nr:glycine betaine ABC transporter substrate-binding protein [Ornithinibacillus halophilus]SHG81711.1 osmoprotectant transport system substrate-binding protein [Ornithinibacillus halophilus]